VEKWVRVQTAGYFVLQLNLKNAYSSFHRAPAAAPIMPAPLSGPLCALFVPQTHHHSRERVYHLLR